MLRKILAGATIILLAAPCVYAKDTDRNNFGDKDLKHGYVLRVRGFNQNETAAPFHSGELTALGLIHFDGNGGVTGGKVAFTVADNGGGVAVGDQVSCTASIDPTTSTYTISANGTGTLTLTFASSPACISASGEGQLVFAVVIDNDDSKNASLALTGFSPGLTVGTETIQTLAMDGAITKRHQ